MAQAGLGLAFACGYEVHADDLGWGGGAGPIYTREEGKGEGKKYGEGGISFAQSRRFYREELGPSHKGPFISNVGSP